MSRRLSRRCEKIVHDGKKIRLLSLERHERVNKHPLLDGNFPRSTRRLFVARARQYLPIERWHRSIIHRSPRAALREADLAAVFFSSKGGDRVRVDRKSPVRSFVFFHLGNLTLSHERT